MKICQQYKKHCGMMLTLSICVLATLSGPIKAQVFSQLADPLFGIEFDPGQVRFEIAPAFIGQRCQELSGRKLWVFAHSASAGRDYYILNGYLRNPGANPPTNESDFGLGIILEGMNCSVMTADELMSGEIPVDGGKTTEHTPLTVLAGLSSDALHRMTVAFGGREKFKVQLSRAVADHDAYEAKLPPALRSDYPPVLRKYIEDFLKQP